VVSELIYVKPKLWQRLLDSELTAWVDGWPVWRVMETGHLSTRVVETGLCKLTTELQNYTHTLFISFRAIGKEIFAREVDAVPVKVVRLEETRPELLLGHLVRNILIMLLPYYIHNTYIIFLVNLWTLFTYQLFHSSTTLQQITQIVKISCLFRAYSSLTNVILVWMARHDNSTQTKKTPDITVIIQHFSKFSRTRQMYTARDQLSAGDFNPEDVWG